MASLRLPAAVVALALASSVGVARAETDYFKSDAQKPVTFRVDKSRTTKQRLVIGALLGGAVLCGGIGLYYHLDSRDAADEVRAVGGPTSLVWDQGKQATYDRAGRSGTRALIGYGAGGVFVVATLVAIVLTQPGSELVSVEGQESPKQPIPVSVAPVRGGAVLGGTWSF